MTNQKIAQSLELLADLLEFTGANPFRLKAYRTGARVINELPESIESLVKSNQDLTRFDGIGKGVAEKCQELVETGKMERLEEILETVPKTVLDLLRVPKLGPKKAATLFNELGIQSLDQLREACESGQVQKLAGFGEKTEAAILAGIDSVAAANRRILWAKADRWVERLRTYLQTCEAIEQMEFAGSYRRGKDTVGDLDILVTSHLPDAVMDHFGSFEDVESVIARGDTKMSVVINDHFQIDLRVVPTESFGAALQYFTGSKEHNVAIRGRARDRGLKVNEWGVFRIDDDGLVAGQTEESVYQSLGLSWIDPELREGREEIYWAETGTLPKLIELQDVIGDLHMHTNATDGSATIEQMAAAARERGLKYIAITDHSKRVAMANGLTAERLLAQWQQIDAINRNADDDFRILKGIECDILEDGELDLPDDVLAQGDWIIASLHYGQHQPRQQITNRILAAIENPHVDQIAHPTGRLLTRRQPYDVDMEAVFKAAQKHGKKLELNSSPYRLDLNEIYLQQAKALGIPIVINTDAHRPQGLDDMRYGIKQARRGGLTANDVANTRGWKELLN